MFPRLRSKHLVLSTALVLLATQAATTSAAAQPTPPAPKRSVVQRLEARDGLPDRHVNNLTIGPDGALWIGTREGLARFNGTELDSESYRRLPPGSASYLAFDRSNRLWVCGRRGVDWLPDPPVPPLPGGDWQGRNDKPVLTADGQGSVWIVTAECAFCHDGGAVHRVEIDENWRLNAALASKPAAAGGLFTVGNDGAIGHITLAGVRRCTSPPPDWSEPNPQSWAVGEDPQGRLWLAWKTNQSHLFVWSDGKWEDVAAALEPDTWVRSFAPGSAGTWLAGTEQGGITEFHDGPHSFTHHRICPRDPINTLVVDRVGTWWLGTAQSGVLKVPPLRGQMLAGTGPEVCRSLGIAPDGRLLVGTTTGGLLEEHEGSLIPSPRTQQAGMDTVNAMLKTGHGLWMGGEGNLRLLEPGGWRSLPGLPATIGQESVMSLAQAPDGAIWAAGSGGQLFRIDPATWTWIRIDLGFGNAWNYDLKFQGSRLWISSTAGLYSMDVDHPDRPPKRWEEIGEPRAMLVKSQDTLYVATRDDGLIVLSGNGITSIAAARGLTSRALHQLVEDVSGDLWIGTSDGLVRLRHADLELALSDPRHMVVPETIGTWSGLKSASCTWGGSSLAMSLPDGRLAFTTYSGVTVLDPREQLPIAPAPVVQVVRLEVDGEPLPVAPAAVVSFVNPRLLRITFEGVSLENPAGTGFRWRLDPEASNWTPVESGRSITIVRPSRGSHVFRLQGRAADGVWHDATPVKIRILPYWWQTDAFRIALGLLALALPAWSLHLFYRARDRRRALLEAATRRVHAERTRISRDLHDELGNRLSELQLLAENVERGGDVDRPGLRSRLKGRAIEAIASLDQLVWLLNPRHDTWGSLARMLEREGSDYLEIAGIDLRFSAPAAWPPQPPDPALRRAMLLAHREILHNVVRHSGAMHVDVRLKVENGEITLDVIDDGRGFDPDAAFAEGRGLAGLRQRAVEFDGSLSVSSQPGRSVVSVTFSPAEPVPAGP